MSSKSEFFRMFEDAPCLEKLTNLDAKGAKRTWRCELQTSIRVFSKICSCILTVGCQSFAQYIRMLYPGRFILVESVIFFFHINYFLPRENAPIPERRFDFCSRCWRYYSKWNKKCCFCSQVEQNCDIAVDLTENVSKEVKNVHENIFKLGTTAT